MTISIQPDEINELIISRLSGRIQVRLEDFGDDRVKVIVRKYVPLGFVLKRFLYRDNTISAEFNSPLINLVISLIPSAIIRRRIKIESGRIGFLLPETISKMAEIKSFAVTPAGVTIIARLLAQTS